MLIDSVSSFSGVFITGTDTNCGKTITTLALMRLLQILGFSVAGMKPVATGASLSQDRCYNDDARFIQKICGLPFTYELINPYVFVPPIAPHLASLEAGVVIDPQLIVANFKILKSKVDIVVVEGVGGWLVPLGNNFYVADLPRLLDIPVLLVVGLRLGCINHTLLTVASIKAHNCNFLGWIANLLDSEMSRVQSTIDTLTQLIPAPFFGHMPYLTTTTDAVVLAQALCSGLVDANCKKQVFGIASAKTFEGDNYAESNHQDQKII